MTGPRPSLRVAQHRRSDWQWTWRLLPPSQPPRGRRLTRQQPSALRRREIRGHNRLRVATLLYPVTDRPFRELYEMARGWSAARRAEVLDVALESRTRRDDLLAGVHVSA